MKLLAFTSKKAIHQGYSSLLNKYKTYQGVVDILKIGGLAIAVFSFTLIYLYFVNKSSTQGYFLRQANNDLNTIKFRYEIVKTTVLNHKQLNRQEMHDNFGSKDRVIDVSPKIVDLQSKQDLAIRP
ncbi:hypothetical protein K9M48_03485 [Candidatus Gracilibacteria bacterium]|nr:hypothetical protein [Candidatus Gracilibacteria bacterium]